MTGRVSKRYTQMGIDRLIRLEWLQRTAQLALANYDISAIKDVLEDELKDSFQSVDTTIRGALDKTITILLRVWVRPNPDLRTLRGDGLELISNSSSQVHIAIHWGMITAAYPFWGNVAAAVGRLLRLQGPVTAAQVQRRLREQYGERETVAHRVRKVLRCFVDWGVLNDTDEKGTYIAGRLVIVDQPKLIAWIVEACLRARLEGSVDFRAFYALPSLFPFELNRVSADEIVTHSPRISLVRHGVDKELLVLKNS